jgi:hypothetical protein
LIMIIDSAVPENTRRCPNKQAVPPVKFIG